MLTIALKMLFGDITKTIGLVFGIAFSVLLMTQQGGFFVGLISRAASIVLDARNVDIWVMDPSTESAEATQPLRALDLARVKGVAGVLAAFPLSRSPVTVKTAEGRTEAATVFGLDDSTLTGMSSVFSVGGKGDLLVPDAIAIDILGYTKLFPGEPITTGRVIELNDTRAVIRAITDAQPGFSSPIIINARLSQAARFSSTGAVPTFVLVTVEFGAEAALVATAIEAATGLKAMTSADFTALTLSYVIGSAGIAFSFGVVIALGAIVGVAIVGLTFNMFIADLSRQFAVLKAIGLTNGRIVLMLLAQAFVIGFIGYGIGLWAASGFFDGVNQPTSDLKGFYLPWQIAFAAAAATLAISVLATFVSLRKVLRLDPATVFRG
jgi:putative ABC transport system permease protein